MIHRTPICAALILTSALCACIGEGPSDASDTEVARVTAAFTARENAVYYAVRPDFRRCAAPLCGGVFVKRLNRLSTRCSNGSRRRECYVATIEQPLLEGEGLLSGPAIARGTIESQTFEGFGELGHFVVTEQWRAASVDEPIGVFYRVTDNGIDCVASPCPSLHADKLNRRRHADMAGLDLAEVDASAADVDAAHQALVAEHGLLVAARRTRVSGPAGSARALVASQFYLPVPARGPSCEGVRCESGTHCEVVDVRCITSPCPPLPLCVPDISDVSEPGSPACSVGGCSSELCADEPLVSACVYRPEYDCYRSAACERQAAGQCGWTLTEELERCLAAAGSSLVAL